MIKLRDYQLEAIAAIKRGFSDSTRQFIEMPTGSGKTITFLSYIKCSYPRALIIVPSRELLNQVYNTALLFYHKDEISRKGNGYSEDHSSIHICIINSVNEEYLKTLVWCDYPLVVIDECHHIQTPSYKRLINSLRKDTRFLGVTATPDRLDGLALSEILCKKTYCISTEVLIQKGDLCDIEAYSVKTNIDISDVDDHNGDFSLTQLYTKLSTESRNSVILSLCKKEMIDKKTLVFCINVQHAKEVSKMLNDAGLSSAAIYGEMSEKERQALLSSFRKGEISFLCNCQLLTEGFDEPSIDGIILARPTRSRALFIQMVGRGLRNFKGKDFCKIIDIVDNHKNLSGFNSIISDKKFPELTSFSGIASLRKHIDKMHMDSIELRIEKVNIFGEKHIDLYPPTESMNEYIETNNLSMYGQLSFNEASFLIWYTQLQKEYSNGCNN